ncbi:MAG TPA: T9SS type A sorting domain-containing protein, partial [Hanamia sp.]|nr:T9SS type A sorting domain-containing protein [Hanamia sp.]
SASYAANRFEVVFRTLSAMPVTFTSITAVQKNADIEVDWKVENESGIQRYEVEESGDGNQFTQVTTVAPQNNGSGNYSWLDENAIAGYHYYRVRSVGKDGQVQYTQIVKVLIGKMDASFSVYPNPIVNGNIHLAFKNEPAGVYGVRLLNSLGQVIVSKVINHGGGSSNEEINPDNRLAKGIYQLEVTKPDGNVEVMKVIK